MGVGDGDAVVEQDDRKFLPPGALALISLAAQVSPLDKPCDGDAASLLAASLPPSTDEDEESLSGTSNSTSRRPRKRCRRQRHRQRKRSRLTSQSPLASFLRKLPRPLVAAGQQRLCRNSAKHGTGVQVHSGAIEAVASRLGDPPGFVAGNAVLQRQGVKASAGPKTHGVEVYVGGLPYEAGPKEVRAAVEELFLCLPEYLERYGGSGDRDRAGGNLPWQSPVLSCSRPKTSKGPTPNFLFVEMRDMVLACTMVAMSGFTVCGKSVRTGWAEGMRPDANASALNVEPLRRNGSLPWVGVPGEIMLNRVYVGSVPPGYGQEEIKDALASRLWRCKEVEERFGSESRIYKEPVVSVAFISPQRFTFVELANEVLASTLVSMKHVRVPLLHRQAGEGASTGTVRLTVGWPSQLIDTERRTPPSLLACRGDAESEWNSENEDDVHEPPPDEEGLRSVFLGGIRGAQHDELEEAIQRFFFSLTSFKATYPTCHKPVSYIRTGKGPFAFAILVDGVLASTLVAAGTIRLESGKNVQVCRPSRFAGRLNFPDPLELTSTACPPPSISLWQQRPEGMNAHGWFHRYPAASVYQQHGGFHNPGVPPPPPPPRLATLLVNQYSGHWHPRRPHQPNHGPAPGEAALWVGNLPKRGACKSMLDEHLNRIALTVPGIDFEAGPPITNVFVHRSGAYAFAEVRSEDLAKQLIPVLDGSLYMGFHLSVELSRRQHPSGGVVEPVEMDATTTMSTVAKEAQAQIEDIAQCSMKIEGGQQISRSRCGSPHSTATRTSLPSVSPAADDEYFPLGVAEEEAKEEFSRREL